MAFGEEAITAERNVGVGYGTPPVRQDYTGYEKEAESGLEFAQARFQNPVHGRFTSVDPLTASASIKNPQSFNRYTYALNSPYKFTDPLGLLSEYTSGACGSRCKNSYTGENSGPMTSGGTESPFEKEFAAMQESRAVDDAAALAATVVHEALHGSLIAPAASALIQDSEVSDPNNLCNPHLAFESSFLPAESNPATVMSSVPLHRLPKFIAALNKIFAYKYADITIWITVKNHLRARHSAPSRVKENSTPHTMHLKRCSLPTK